MTELHVYWSLDDDLVIASDAEDAQTLLYQEVQADMPFPGWRILEPTTKICVRESLEDGVKLVTRSAQEWIQIHGRGYLCPLGICDQRIIDNKA